MNYYFPSLPLHPHPPFVSGFFLKHFKHLCIGRGRMGTTRRWWYFSKSLVTVYKALLMQYLEVDHFGCFPMRVTLKKDVFLDWLASYCYLLVSF